MCRQNGDIITFKTNVSDTFSATYHKDSTQLAMQLKVLLQTKRPHIKPTEGVIANEASSHKTKL
jgi:hypothetical protein